MASNAFSGLSLSRVTERPEPNADTACSSPPHSGAMPQLTSDSMSPPMPQKPVAFIATVPAAKAGSPPMFGPMSAYSVAVGA